MDRIFKNGATSYNVLTSEPTISAQCWGSMLLGCSPEVHGYTNESVSVNKRVSDNRQPSVFRRIRNAYPEAELCAFSCWNPINNGIIENDIGVVFGSADDKTQTLMILEYLNDINHKSPHLLFIQFDGVDAVGHGKGYGSTEHLDEITKIDAYIGSIYNKLEDLEILKDTLFIVTADHGGTLKGTHGGDSDAEKYVFFGAAGENISEGSIGDMNIRDTAAVILHAFGITVPEFDFNGFSAQLPDGIFKDTPVPPRMAL